MASWFTVREVKGYSGDWRGLNVTFPGVGCILPIGWYVTPWGNMTPALTFKSI